MVPAADRRLATRAVSAGDFRSKRHFGELPRWHRRRIAGSQHRRRPRATLAWATLWRAAPVVPVADRRLAPRAVAAGDCRSKRHFGDRPRRYRYKSQDRNAAGARRALGRLSLSPERHLGELPRWYRRRVAGSQRGRCPRATFGLSDTLASCPGGTGGGSQARNTGGTRGRLSGLRAGQARSYLLHGASCPEGNSATQAQRRPREGGGK